MKSSTLGLVICLAAGLGAGRANAVSGNHYASEPEVARCIKQAAQGKEWLEKTLWGLRDQEAGWIGAEVLNTNGSHDLGVLQVNSAWVPRVASMLGQRSEAVRVWLRDDPCFNAQVGRWIFLSSLRQAGDYWKAVGIYHSPTAWRQKAYAANVAQHLRHRFGDGVFISAERREGRNKE